MVVLELVGWVCSDGVVIVFKLFDMVNGKNDVYVFIMVGDGINCIL